jgi:hypothetical protein
MLGNYMNGASHNGGAFGFKIASINKVQLSFTLILETARFTSKLLKD